MTQENLFTGFFFIVIIIIITCLLQLLNFKAYLSIPLFTTMIYNIYFLVKVPAQGRKLFRFDIRNPFRHRSCTLCCNSRYRSIILERFRYDEKILISAIIIFILVMPFYVGACTRAKNIFHCLMYIIFSNIAHVHCNLTEAYNSRYHHTLCLGFFGYDERNAHLCNNCNLICSLEGPYKEKLFHCW